jgi:hypothetical protein
MISTLTPITLRIVIDDVPYLDAIDDLATQHITLSKKPQSRPAPAQFFSYSIVAK